MAKKNKLSLKRRLLFIIITFWIVPVSIMVLFITVSYRNNFTKKTERLIEHSIYNFSAIIGGRIEEAISISRNISYDMDIEEAWKQYKRGDISETEFYNTVINNLKLKYYNDVRFVMSALLLSDEPSELYYITKEPISYPEMHNSEIINQSRKISEENSVGVYIKIIDNKIYMIRNLYTTGLEKFGTLVVELNKEKLFEGISFINEYEYTLYINDIDTSLVYQKQIENDDVDNIIYKLEKKYKENNQKGLTRLSDASYIGLLLQEDYKDFNIGTTIILDKKVVFSGLEHLMYIMIGLILAVIPIYIYVLYLVFIHILAPIEEMKEFAKQIEVGKLGIQIEGPMPNKEFDYLAESFNKMSCGLETLVEYDYKEQISRKEAKIIALHSQINPEFLYSTLDLANWQAKLAGDTKVSEMITALGTVLDYSIEHKNKKVIPLSEELQGIEAYLYILSMQYGQRLEIKKEIDDNLLYIEVPHLILQPIIDNAISHGLDKVNTGVIILKIYRVNEVVYIQVINSAKELTGEEMSIINKILDGTYIPDNTETHTSLGIKNVNERIKLIYGEYYGLNIEPYNKDGLIGVVSTITIPFQ